MKKLLAILLAMMLSMSVLTGCGSDKTSENKDETTQEQTAENANNMVSDQCKGNVLNWNLAYDTETLDPAQSTTADSRSLVNNLFEGLMRDTGDGAKPALAKEMPTEKVNEDGTITLTYTLKESKWSDGKPVTANDFEYGWKRCADPENHNANAYLMNVLNGYKEILMGSAEKDTLGVKAVDASTLEVTLKQKTPYFNELLTLPAFMPVREDMKDFKNPETAVSNGPFVLAGYTAGTEMVLRKNDQYHNAEAVSLDYIVARMFDEEFAPIAMAYGDAVLNTGKVEPTKEYTDAEGKVTEIPPLPETLKETVVSTNTVVNLLVNQKTENPLLKDQKVRAALSVALDRTAAAKAVGNAAALTSVAGTSGELLPASPVLEDAKKLMDEYLTANPEAAKTIEIVYLKNDELTAALGAVQNAWKALGIEVTLTAQDAETFKKTRTEVSYKDMLCTPWETDVPDNQLYLDVYLTSNIQSGCGYSNTDFDEAMIAAIKADEAEKTEKLLDAEKILLKDAYVMPLYQKTMTVTSDSARVSGWKLLPNGAYWFGDTALTAADEEAKTEKPAETEKTEKK